MLSLTLVSFGVGYRMIWTQHRLYSDLLEMDKNQASILLILNLLAASLPLTKGIGGMFTNTSNIVVLKWFISFQCVLLCCELAKLWLQCHHFHPEWKFRQVPKLFIMHREFETLAKYYILKYRWMNSAFSYSEFTSSWILARKRLREMSYSHLHSLSVHIIC